MRKTLFWDSLPESDEYDPENPKSEGFLDRLLDLGDDSRDQAAGR